MATRGWPAASIGVAGLVLSGGFATNGTAEPLPRGPLERNPPHVVGPPPAHTGGFGEPTCLECHTGSDLNEPGSTLEVIGLGTMYVPGASVEITIRLRSFDMNAAGFQAAFRWADGPRAGQTAGSLATTDDRVGLTDPSITGVQYVQHTSSGVPADGEEAAWTFEWTAPAERGTIALHVAANSGNGDNSPLDDLVYTAEIRLESGG
ncbi:MAG: choice-of-anchor V domain-containing protein [Gemmatimonadota bacterium]|nr:choice-of-anchor V domain-containing protein [Gemmatimonadota bacterium]